MIAQTSAPSTFAWYGLGSMGLGMASNLQSHLSSNGFAPLHYSNRTLSRGESLRELGAVSEDSFEAVIEFADVVFTMISNDAVLEDLVRKALASNVNLKGKVWVDCSTVHPDTCLRCSESLLAKGATFIASPVFGASPVAAAGKLIFSMAGPKATIETLRPYIVDVMGRSIINMGEDVRKSSLLKITGNIFVIGFQELIAEAQVFAEKTGLGTAQLEQFIADMFGPVLESYSKRMTTGAWAPPLDQQPGFAVALAHKDATHAVNIAKGNGSRLLTVENALRNMDSARSFAGESLDSSCVYGALRQQAGLPFWSENSRQSN